MGSGQSYSLRLPVRAVLAYRSGRPASFHRLAPVDDGRGSLRPLDSPFGLVGALCLEALELLAEEGVHGVGWHRRFLEWARGNSSRCAFSLEPFSPIDAAVRASFTAFVAA